MRLVMLTAATAIVLWACGSNQPADSDRVQNTDPRKNIQKAVEIIPQQSFPVVPIDGRLRDEHIQMYVSVKIRQEQLCYEQNITYVKRQNKRDAAACASSKKANSSRTYEKLAIKEFDFNDQLFYWVKRTVNDATVRRAKTGPVSGKRASSFEESVAIHNMRMIQKYQDELTFALNYRIPAPTSMAQQTTSTEPNVAAQQTALFLQPSS
jgi:hypothetical protein